MISPYEARVRALRKLVSAAGADVLLVSHQPNWFYLTGFTGESGMLLLGDGKTTLISDGRFSTQARDEAPSVQYREQKGSLTSGVADLLKEKRWRRAGYDPNHLTVSQFNALKKAVGSGVKWVPAPGLVESLRTRKESSELAIMRRAVKLGDQVISRAISLLKPGVTENEIAAEIEHQMRRGGASGPAFETIVAFGERAALPHARPTAKRLKKNELVVLDLGVILAHYCSDITRTVYVGRAPSRVKTWYGAVQRAQRDAIEAAKVGTSCGDVDAAARQTLTRYRLEQYFTHSTGHGLGLEVHEDPRLARGQTAQLESGFVVTIEPGIYIPGVGGIRIEDDVAVHSEKTEVLTRASRDLIEL
ncbi:MAG TPA: Xaa-Pro peptidase family protein [Candidatus Acidoferrum sp.]|nr:Xaa-Pro peptidase family protein [Candidatus Acidoferrum sp.]